MKNATVTEILDGVSFRLRTDAIIVLNGVQGPPRGSDADKKAKSKLVDLVLKKKIQYETTEWDTFGRTLAKVSLDGVDINTIMSKFIKTL